MLIGSDCSEHVSYIEVMNKTSQVEHEASTSRISEINCFI
jgi:Fe-S cluster assembly scaffold protein SufB